MKTPHDGLCVENKCIDLDCGYRGRCIMDDSDDLNIKPACYCGDSLGNSNECKTNPCLSTIEPNCHIEHTEPEPCDTEHYDVVCKCKSPMYGGKYCDKINVLCEANKCHSGATCVQNGPETCCYCDFNSIGK